MPPRNWTGQNVVLIDFDIIAAGASMFHKHILLEEDNGLFSQWSLIALGTYIKCKFIQK